MPYDPRMMQAIGRMGLGMMSPQPQPTFDNPANQPPPQRPRQWWENLPPMPRPGGQSANQPDDTGQSANSPKGPPSLYDLMLQMSRPQNDKAMQGPGAQNAAGLGPWAWLGSMGGGGGTR